MTKRFGLSATALVGAVVGAAAMGAISLAPDFVTTSDAQPIVLEPPLDAPMSFADLIDQVSPAVVSVNVVSEREVSDLGDMDRFMERFRGMPGFEDFMERRRDEDSDDDNEESGPRTQEARSLGSGFFISADGYIVTNNHVVEGATEIEVAMEGGATYDAELVGTDPQTDLAVLRVTEAETFPFVEFGSSVGMRRGDWVVALGNPFGLGGTATAGIISADDREIGGSSNPYTDFLQIDAAINRGNSGGPTFDLEGRVIGVNTAIFSPTGGSVGIGFAIPADLAKTITDTLIRDGRVSRGWLGVTISDVRDDIAESLELASDEGAIINDVTEGSPADKAGLQRGDIVLSVNGRTVRDSTRLTRAVGSLIAGSTNDFGVLRDGEQIEVAVTVGERPSDPQAAFRRTEPASDETPGDAGPLGGSYTALTSATREALDLESDEPGLYVTDVSSDSVLDEAGVRSGMAILEVNGDPVSSVSEMEKAIAAAKRAGRERVLLAVQNSDITTFITVEVE
ncbi:MAG: Do family serine endopeptidase [Pseudomonadota bacterium]